MNNLYYVVDTEVFIELNNEYWTIINLEDLQIVESVKSWHLSKNPNLYAVTSYHESRYMHRLILGLTKMDLGVDHRNRDSLDNRRKNLRTASQSINRYNSSISTKNSSGATGVCFNKQVGRWEAYITIDRKRILLGRFFHKRDAIDARLKAEDAYV